MKKLEEYYTPIPLTMPNYDEDIIDIFTLLELDLTGLVFYGKSRFSYKGIGMKYTWDDEEDLVGIKVDGSDAVYWFDCADLKRSCDINGLSKAYQAALTKQKSDERKAEVYACRPECTFTGTHAFVNSSSLIGIDVQNPTQVNFRTANLQDNTVIFFTMNAHSPHIVDILNVLVNGGSYALDDLFIYSNTSANTIHQIFVKRSVVQSVYRDSRQIGYQQLLNTMLEYYTQLQEWARKYVINFDCTYTQAIDELFNELYGEN